MTEVEQFCRTYDACDAGAKWATAHHTTMRELWSDTTMRDDWRVWVATREGVLSDKELRLFACYCARSVWHMLDDDRSKKAVEVAEAHTRGDASEAELRDATRAAADASAAADAAAHAAQAAYAANAAARAVYAASNAASYASYAAYAAYNAASDASDAANAASYAAYAANAYAHAVYAASNAANAAYAYSVAYATQAEWLLDHTSPFKD